MATWKLYFDGAFTNGIPMFGWTLQREGIEADKGNGAVDLLNEEMTTNVAEYGGLVAGLTGALKWVKQHDTLAVYGDSQLVVRQISGQYRIKKLHLMPYAMKARELLRAARDSGITVALDWIPREQNTRADELSKMPAPAAPATEAS
jgi:ribonuclease HI